MHAKGRLLIERTFIILFLIITLTGCNSVNRDIDNGSNTSINSGDSKEKDYNKNNDNYNINRNDIKINLHKDLDNNDELKTIISDCFYKYYGIKIPQNELNIFNIFRNVDTDNNEIIINAFYEGEIDKHNYHLNIVINHTNKIMERIDARDYNIKEQETEITSEHAEKIAEEYLIIVDKEKYKSSGTIKVSKNRRDGYQVIFTDKIDEKNVVLVSINPYSLQVTSYVVHWS